MKRAILFICIILANHIYANDAWVESAGGNYILLGGKNKTIKLVSEKMNIGLYEKYYEMDIEYTFFNDGEPVELKVGFPEYYYGTMNITNIRNFVTYINNEVVEIEKIKNDNNLSEIDLGYLKINYWYVKNVVFKSNEYTISRVQYIADYANYGSYKGVDYLYGTASTWNDKIDQMIIEIQNNTNFWLNKFSIGAEREIIRENDNKIKIILNDVVPNITDTFSVIFSGFPVFEMPPYAITEKRWRLSRVIISPEELILLNKEQLRILRNSIYAYNGYEFKSEDLREFFGRQYWYKINENFNENKFSPNEKINLENIIKEERRRN